MKLSLRNVVKTYGPQRALDGFNLEIDDARCLCLVGPSGGGKSTALRLLAGLELPDSGSIEIDGQPIPRTAAGLRAYRASVGTVFQAYNLFPHLDAQANITLPLVKVHGQTEAAARRRAAELLERFRLADHAHKRPAELSGGQNQRVAIARAIAHNPRALLFDEPTSALDPEMTAEVLDIIEDLIREGANCIVVTHQMGFARRVSDHAAFVAAGQVAESSPTPKFFTTPATPATQSFLQRTLRY